MGCCNYISRFISVVIGILSLTQSIIWIALAFLGLALYNCNIQVHYKQNGATYLIFLAYFYTDCAISPNIELEIDDSAISTFLNGTVTWPNRLESVYTTHQLNLAYAVLSCLWAVTSLVLIGASICKTKILFAYLPWILTTAANLVLDVVATVTFAQHISKTQGLENFLNFLGVVYPVDMLPKVPDELTIMPSVIMTLVSARFVLLWLLNLIILICGLWAAWNLTNHSSKQNNMGYRQPLADPPSGSDSKFEPPKPFSYIPGTMVKNQPTSEQADTTEPKAPADSEFQQKATLSKQLAPQLQRLQNRLSTYSPGLMPSEDQVERRRLSHNTRPPEELRGQLPWSYFNARDELRPAANQPRSWDRPPVPVPDYTLHFGRKTRYSQPDNISSSSSSSPSPKRLA